MDWCHFDTGSKPDLSGVFAANRPRSTRFNWLVNVVGGTGQDDSRN